MKKSLKLMTSIIAVSSCFITFTGGVVAEHHGKAAIEAAVAHADRTAEEKARDANRHPVEVLEFAGIEPGMTVLDINSAGGYYTEILSHAVGPNGKVYAHNGPVYWDFVKDSVSKRYEGRLGNVELLSPETEAVDLPEGSVDVAIMVLAYHDFYFVHKARAEPQADVESALASYYKALKQGGRILIIDHVGPRGADAATINKLHRIDPDRVFDEMAAAGFELDAESDLLANPEDGPTESPFRKDMRGMTDRFMHLYVKP
ncbi:class I SAM-dependent methyltransferase [Kordiimonas aestuarii]|uniref:class I SAM-dependent methyltransferase n=1 Tax=Kordiimonas aestuarii TaxID=1005925 RepID=UPI0021D1F699|nr:methyltransferase domain-containing protein [Kordiimonas aestuarii]